MIVGLMDGWLAKWMSRSMMVGSLVGWRVGLIDSWLGLVT